MRLAAVMLLEPSQGLTLTKPLILRPEEYEYVDYNVYSLYSASLNFLRDKHRPRSIRSSDEVEVLLTCAP